MNTEKLIQEEGLKNNKNRNMIIAGFLLLLIPIPLVVSIDMLFGYPNQILYWIFMAISIIFTVNGICIISLCQTKISENYFKIKSIIFNILITILTIFFIFVFIGTLFIIIEDPHNYFELFDNPGRIQLFIIFGLVFIINTSYLLIKKLTLSKFNMSLYLAAYIFLFSYGYIQTIPKNIISKVFTYDEFKNTLINYDYSVSKTNRIENNPLSNSTIFIATKDNTTIYYIITDKISTAKKLFKSINLSEFNSCPADTLGGISGNYKHTQCQEHNCLTKMYILSNVITYVETNLENEQIVDEILTKLCIYHIK